MNTSTKPEPAELVKRSGTISNYKVTRAEASFVFSDADRTRFGAVAIAAGILGLGAQAVSTASYASSTEEAADFVEFELDGLVVKGWVWRSPFKDGDVVEVVGRMFPEGLEAVAIARPHDRVVALYPHCSRGKGRHFWNAARWWVMGTMMVLFSGAALFTVFLSTSAAYGEAWSMLAGAVLFFGCPVLWLLRGTASVFLALCPFVLIGAFQVGNGPNRGEFFLGGSLFSAAFLAFFGLMTFSLTRKWLPFVRVAEQVFTAFGWPNPGSIDLVKSSKAQRRPDDPAEYGTFWFRY